MQNRKFAFFLIFTMCLALAGYINTLNYQGMLMWDEAEYAVSARTFLSGETYLNALRPPMMGLLGSLSLGLYGQESDVILKLPIVLIAVSACVSLYTLIGKIDTPFSGLMAALTLAFMPSFWEHTAFFLAEIPFILFFQCAILCFYLGLYKKTSWLHGAWIFVGLAFLTRYTALLLGPMFLLLLLIKFLISKEEFIQLLRKKSFWMAPFWMFLLMTPWLIHQYITHGDFLVGFKIAANQLSIYAPEVSMPWHYYLTNLTTMAGYPVTTILILSCVLIVYKKDLFGINCLVILLFLLVWFSSYRYKELRLITSILPMVAVLVGIFFGIMKRDYVTQIDKGLFITGFIIVSIYFGFAHNYLKFKNFRTLGYPTLTEAMIWLESNSKKSDLILGASTPQIEWYSNRKVIGLPRNMDQFRNALEHCEWVVVVNYERGQPKYLSETIKSEIYEELLKSGEAQIFRSPNGYFTIVMSSSALIKSLEFTPNQ